MEDKIITFSANEQGLQKTGGISHYASDTVSYVKATFDLGTNWQGFDEVRAVFKTPFDTRSAVLNSLGECEVPFEILMHKAVVRVNLVGSIVTEEEVTDRLTTYSVEALTIDEDVPISGDSSVPITPSEYEQFVAKVKEDANRAEAEAESALASAQASEASAIRASGHALDAESSATSARAYAQNAQNSATNAENAKDDAIDARDEIRSMRANAETLEPNQSATASCSNGVLTLGIPKGQKGDKGDTPNLSIGNVTTLEPSADAYVTRRGTDANPIFDFGIPKGDKGDNGTVPDLDLILPTDTASGSIASITDGQSVVPVKSLKVTLEPIQSGSGDPSPSNPRPISGHTEVVTEVCGVNVWDEEWEVGSINSSTGDNSPTTTQIRSKNYIPCKPSTAYYFQSPMTSNDVRIAYYGADKSFRSMSAWLYNGVFTTPSDCEYIRFYTATAYGTTYGDNISINYPSTDTSYHAHDGTTYTTALGRTVYGGTLDVVSGELVVDRAMDTFVGDSITRIDAIGGVPFARVLASEYITQEGSWVDVRNSIKCNAYTSSDTSASGNIQWAVRANQKVVRILDDRFTDLETAKAILDAQPVQYCYPIATPQTYQLTPQTISLLHGNNNVWSDGSVEVTYNADVGLYIDKKLGTSGTRTLSMTRTLETKSEDTDDTKSDNIQLAED